MRKGSNDASGSGKEKKPGQWYVDPIPVIYPKYPYKIKEEAGKDYILDEFRKKWLLLTPEEWVRQNFIRYLADNKKCPPRHILLLNGKLLPANEPAGSISWFMAAMPSPGCWLNART